MLVNGSFGIVDADLASVIWQDLLAVSFNVLISLKFLSDLLG